MPNLPEIEIQPELLRWARESIGVKIDDVAHALDVAKQDVVRWESEARPLRLTQLEKLSELYKRPLAAFFLPAVPKEPSLPRDFRKLPDSDSLSPASRLAIRRARRLRSIAIELAEALKEKPQNKIHKINTSAQPETVAATAREKLAVPLERQFRWRDSRHALAEWRAAIEKMGVLVFQLPMPLKEVRGFSISEDEYPTIVINTKDTVNGRIFSLLHEYAHVLLHAGGLCDMHENDSLPSGISIEHFCNWFSGSVLVPRGALLNHRLTALALADGSFSGEIINGLAKSFKVSQDVILRRLLTMELISKDVYQRKIKELEAFYKTLPKKASGGAPPAAIAVQENGVPFSSMVLTAYRNENISSKEVSDYLGLRHKHLPAVEKILRGKAKQYE